MAGLIPIETANWHDKFGASNSPQSSFLSFVHLFDVKSVVNGASDSLIIFFKQASVEQSLDTLVLRHWIPQKAVHSFLLFSFSSRLVTMLLFSCCQYLTCIFQLLRDSRIFPGNTAHGPIALCPSSPSPQQPPPQTSQIKRQQILLYVGRIDPLSFSKDIEHLYWDISHIPYHIIYPFKVYKSMVFYMFTDTFKYHHSQLIVHCYHFQKKLSAVSLPCPLIPASPINHDLFVSVDMPVLIFHLNIIIYYVVSCDGLLLLSMVF